MFAYIQFLVIVALFSLPCSVCWVRGRRYKRLISPPTAAPGPPFRGLQAAWAASSLRVQRKLAPYPGRSPWQLGRMWVREGTCRMWGLLGFVLAGRPNDTLSFPWKVLIPKLLDGHLDHSGLWDEHFCLLCLHSWRSMIAFGRNWYGHFT